MANTALSPIVASLSMVAWRVRRGKVVLRIDKFRYGYLSTLSFALMRFWFASLR